jgi:para-aminobenzoate synthetase component 1
MNYLNKEEAIARMDAFAKDNKAFIFVISYDKTSAIVEALDDITPDELMFNFSGVSNIPSGLQASNTHVDWQFTKPSPETYHRSFTTVQHAERAGDSYLVNFTCRVPLHTNLTLRDIFLRTKARYRLWISGKLVCFSPEIFVRLKKGIISSYPMKGTIDASIPKAEEQLMADKKETAEHATIVDLIRNDLSMVAEHVKVDRYRYVEQINTHRGAILQTSSEISGHVQPHYQEHPGKLIMRLLPAGSITGAPKPKTMAIIHAAETYNRGFYTGCMGIWKDGDIDSAVMIRFVDEEDGQLYYKAGGGITAMSDEESEYNEVIEKIYVPVC